MAGSTARGTAIAGVLALGPLTPVGVDDAAEVELLEAAPVSTAAAARCVGDEEGIELFEGAAPGAIDDGIALGSAEVRAAESCPRAEERSAMSS